jgi:hypothetical protein
MRRRGVSGIGGLCAALTLVVAGLAGCAGRPPGVDGDLTNGWAAMPVAKVAVPVAGVCYSNPPEGIWYGDFNTVPCSGSHASETVFVGTFTERSTPPDTGTPAMLDAYAQCGKGAVAYLGDDFHRGLMDLIVIRPSDGAWTGGARWFRCDVTRYTDPEEGNSKVQGSAKDGLRGARPLAVTCETIADDGGNNITDEQLADCAKPHNSELAGLFTAPNVPWPTDDNARQDMASKGCEAVVAKYLGFTGREDDNPYLGWMFSNFDQDSWTAGDRTVQCSAVGVKGKSSNGVRFVGSVKGLKAGKPRSWA